MANLFEVVNTGACQCLPVRFSAGRAAPSSDNPPNQVLPGFRKICLLQITIGGPPESFSPSYHLVQKSGSKMWDETPSPSYDQFCNQVFPECFTTHPKKHRKNCECCPRHSLFKGHKHIIVNIGTPKILKNARKITNFECELTKNEFSIFSWQPNKLG